MPGVRVESIEGLADPFKQYQFMMFIAPVRGVRTDFLPVDVMSLRCHATSLPGSAIPQVPVELGGFRLMYAGMRQFSHSWTTTLIEGQNQQVMLQLASWMKLCYNQRTGLSTFKQNYQARGMILTFNDPNQTTGMRTLFNIWPQGDPDKALSFASNNRQDIQITWSFDYWDDAALEGSNQGVVVGAPSSGLGTAGANSIFT